MIHLKKGQTLFENTGMVVYDQTGYYNDGDSVLCAMVFAPDEPVCRFEAKFVAYGSLVYNISDPALLLEEVKKIDPASLFGKNKEEVATDKVVDKIEVAESEDLSETSEVSPESETEPKEAEEVIETVNNTPEVTPEIITSTSTPSTSTTTPVTASEIPEAPTEPVVEPAPEPVVEQVIPVIENVIEDLNNISEVIQEATETVTPTNITP